MPATAKHREVEQRFLRLVAEAAVPEPDEVVYDAGSVAFHWHERKLVIFVDLDDPGREASQDPV